MIVWTYFSGLSTLAKFASNAYESNCGNERMVRTSIRMRSKNRKYRAENRIRNVCKKSFLGDLDYLYLWARMWVVICSLSTVLWALLKKTIQIPFNEHDFVIFPKHWQATVYDMNKVWTKLKDINAQYDICRLATSIKWLLLYGNKSNTNLMDV